MYRRIHEFLIKLLTRKISCGACMLFLRSRKRIYHLAQTADVSECLADNRVCAGTKHKTWLWCVPTAWFGFLPLWSIPFPLPAFTFRLRAVQQSHSPLVLWYICCDWQITHGTAGVDIFFFKYWITEFCTFKHSTSKSYVRIDRFRIKPSRIAATMRRRRGRRRRGVGRRGGEEEERRKRRRRRK